jgi:penicillin amidase
MRRLIKWTGRGLLATFALALVVLVAGFFWLRTSLPKTDGEVAVNGLGRSVEIIRDANGVPHIFAANDQDATFALGYVHAQDRLLQMELMRRFGAGRLSEIVGASALRIDRMARTLGMYRRSQMSLKHLKPETRAGLEAYAAGVNAYLATHRGALPLEFQLLGIAPEPWKPADSLVWGRIMATSLATNWRSELLRAYMAQRIGPKTIADLWPPDPADAPITIAGDAGRRTERFKGLPLGPILAAIPEAFKGGASNAWAVSGRHTKTGKPILANDPHLRIGTPILWYLVHIETPKGRRVGATTPGVPTVLLGHNGHIAWGFTNTYADTDDVFIETIDPSNPARYLTPQGPRPFLVRRETIKVKSAKPVTITVRETRHGPVLDGIIGKGWRSAIPKGRVLALSAPWLREDDTTADALLALGHARNWSQFKTALRRWTAPPQNITYADVSGNIGLFTPGLIPIRRSGQGYMPADGATGKNDWLGFIPFDELPQTLNPAAGRVVNANNRLTGPGYKYFLSREWGDHFRAARIAKLLAQTAKHDAASMARIQADHFSRMSGEILPLLLKVKATSLRGRSAIARLRRWNRQMDRSRPEPLIFMAWLREMNRALYADELGKLFDGYWGARPKVVRHMLTKATRWCDVVGTPAKESCESRMTHALDRALGDLQTRYGADVAGWRWGRAHFADFRHPVFSFIPVLRDVASLRIPSNGDGYTVNKASPVFRNKRSPFSQRHGPGFRAIYDLADLERSRFVISTGQSGNPFSRHYGDFLRRWRDIRYVRIATKRAALRETASGILTLRPDNAGK